MSNSKTKWISSLTIFSVGLLGVVHILGRIKTMNKSILLLCLLPFYANAMENHFDYLSQLPLDKGNKTAVINILQNMGEIDAQAALDADQSPHQPISVFLENTRLDHYLPDTIKVKGGIREIPLLCFSKNLPLSHQAKCFAYLGNEKDVNREKFRILIYLDEKNQKNITQSLQKVKVNKKGLTLPKIPKIQQQKETENIITDIVRLEKQLSDKQKKMSPSQRRLNELKYAKYFEKVYAVKSDSPKQKAEHIREFIRFFFLKIR